MTEIELINGCIRQNADCQRILFNMYAGKMMAVCNRYANDAMEAEDMMQEGFIRVYMYMHQFKFEGSFEGWMRRIMVNVALKILRKKRLDFYEINDKAANAPRMDNYAFSNLGEADLMKLIQELPSGYRTVFNLNVIEGFSHDEIGKMLNIESSTSRSQLVKARKLLQAKIEKLHKIAV